MASDRRVKHRGRAPMHGKPGKSFLARITCDYLRLPRILAQGDFFDPRKAVENGGKWWKAVDPELKRSFHELRSPPSMRIARYFRRRHRGNWDQSFSAAAEA